LIYFMQSTDGGPVKIGYSVDVVRRLKQLEYHYKRPLALLATMPGGPDEEAEIHARFDHLRFGTGRPQGQGRRPEQFRPAPELMEFIRRPLLVGANPDAVEMMPGLSQARLELPADQLADVRAVAKSIGLSLATFVRLAVLEKVKRIKEGKG
jgi:hypothetical protein